ncbi:MAG: hypothetical protein WA170_15140, partial [Candidatus Acidiferrales bacterium]
PQPAAAAGGPVPAVAINSVITAIHFAFLMARNHTKIASVAQLLDLRAGGYGKATTFFKPPPILSKLRSTTAGS